MRQNERDDYLKCFASQQRWQMMAHLFAAMLQEKGVNPDQIMQLDKAAIVQMLLQKNRDRAFKDKGAGI